MMAHGAVSFTSNFSELQNEYIVGSRRHTVVVTIDFMERLLIMSAEIESLAIGKNRPYERGLREELLKILEEAELLFGPRDRSYEMLEPRITESFYATPAIYPFKKIRIYLTNWAKVAKHMAAYELSHEAIHVLSPVHMLRPTLLEEGLATYFSFRYVKRTYGVSFESTGDRHYDAALRAVSRLLAKNEFVIKELRTHQPVISKIDVKLLIEVAGVDLELAKFLCKDFLDYRNPPISWSAWANQNAQLFVKGAQSIWDQWTSESKA